MKDKKLPIFSNDTHTDATSAATSEVAFSATPAACQNAWQGATQWIKKRLSPQVFDNWIAPIAFDRCDAHRLSLRVPNRFFADWLSDNYRDTIREAWLQHSQGDVGLILWHIDTSSTRPSHTLSAVPDAPPPAVRTAQPPRLNPRYTFDSFVVGASNQLCHAAATAVANHSGVSYNPLFIYGGVGLGKTHLLHAIGHQSAAHKPLSHICYLSAEEFMNEFISSLKNKQMEGFRQKYRRDCDVLLIDDIQFIAGKASTQDEFFHTFNALYEDNKQIVLTSDKYPQEIPDLEERLRSRFQWGLIADIQAPEFETRVAILRHKAEEERIDLPDEVAMYLASSIRTNIRELEGSLINLAAHASLEGRAIDMDFAAETLKRIIALHQAALTVETIQQTVCRQFNITMADLRGQARHRSVSFPRQIAMYLCRKGLKTSFPEIGQQFGGKDHTTAMAACRKIDKLLQTDPELKNKIEILERTLGF